MRKLLSLLLALTMVFGLCSIAQAEEPYEVVIETVTFGAEYADIPAIARGQLAWEDAARAERPALLILDTHLLSNILWSRILFGDCPDWLEPALLRRRYDLHLLLSPEGVAWSADGQRCQPELAQRQAFHRECQAWLERHRQPYRAIAGDWAERRRQAFAAVQGLLQDG